MTFEDKIDQILQDVASIKVVTSQHTLELIELKRELKPVFFHVTGMQWAMKLTAWLVGLGTLIVGALAMLK